MIKINKCKIDNETETFGQKSIVSNKSQKKYSKLIKSRWLVS